MSLNSKYAWAVLAWAVLACLALTASSRAADLNLTGTWYGAGGVTHVVEHSADGNVTWLAKSGDNGQTFTATFAGRIIGNQLTGTFADGPPGKNRFAGRIQATVIVEAGQVVLDMKIWYTHDPNRAVPWKIVRPRKTTLFGKTDATIRVALQCGASGYFVSADPNPSVPLRVSGEAANVCETFDLMSLDQGRWYSLRAHSNGKFVRLSNGKLVADTADINESLKLKLHVVDEKQQVVCFATPAQKVVQHEPRDAHLVEGNREVVLGARFRLTMPTAYEPAPALPKGVQRQWIPADGGYHKLQWGVGVPGVKLSTTVWAPKGSQARAQYFLTPNGDPTTLDGQNGARVEVAGLYGEVAVMASAASWVFFHTDEFQVQGFVPFTAQPIPGPKVIPYVFPHDLFK